MFRGDACGISTLQYKNTGKSVAPVHNNRISSHDALQVNKLMGCPRQETAVCATFDPKRPEERVILRSRLCDGIIDRVENKK